MEVLLDQFRKASEKSRRAAARKQARTKIVEDLFWSMFNAPEFSWNH